MDDFLSKTKCDWCGSSLDAGRTMSMFNEECICMKCKEEETKRPDYSKAVKADREKWAKEHTNVCCLCGKKFVGYGNNPWPIKEDGICCNECNSEKVVPERIRRWFDDISKKD